MTLFWEVIHNFFVGGGREKSYASNTALYKMNRAVIVFKVMNNRLYMELYIIYTLSPSQTVGFNLTFFTLRRGRRESALQVVLF